MITRTLSLNSEVKCIVIAHIPTVQSISFVTHTHRRNADFRSSPSHRPSKCPSPSEINLRHSSPSLGPHPEPLPQPARQPSPFAFILSRRISDRTPLQTISPQRRYPILVRSSSQPPQLRDRIPPQRAGTVLNLRDIRGARAPPSQRRR